jgi:hypothetical protein
MIQFSLFPYNESHCRADKDGVIKQDFSIGHSFFGFSFAQKISLETKQGNSLRDNVNWLGAA